MTESNSRESLPLLAQLKMYSPRTPERTFSESVSLLDAQFGGVCPFTEPSGRKSFTVTKVRGLLAGNLAANRSECALS